MAPLLITDLTDQALLEHGFQGVSTPWGVLEQAAGAELAEALAAPGLRLVHRIAAAGSGPVGRLVYLVEEADSNFHLVSDLLRRGISIPEGTLFLAVRLRRASGWCGRSWEAPAGNLHLSVYLKPGLPTAGGVQNVTSLVASLAGVEILRRLSAGRLRPLVQWPTDIVLEGAKVGGVLEWARAGTVLTDSLLGLGLDVNVTPRLPYLAQDPFLRGITSLAEVTGQAPPLARQLQTAADSLNRLYRRLKAPEGPRRLLDELRRVDDLRDRRVRLRRDGPSEDGRPFVGEVLVEGVARGIDPEGRLLVESGGELVPCGARLSPFRVEVMQDPDAPVAV